MRVEPIARQGALTDVQAEQRPALPQKGDVIRATVLSQEGESVSLKGEDGRVFNARLASETMLLPNDIAELMVIESTVDKLILRLVFVEPAPQGGVAAETVRTAQTATSNTDTAALIDVFASLHIKPSAQTLATAAYVMERYGADAKTAVFFAANDIVATGESIKAFQTLTEGKTIGKTLYAISQSIGGAFAEATGEAGGVKPALPQPAVNTQETVPQDIATADKNAAQNTVADGAKEVSPQTTANVSETVPQQDTAAKGMVQNTTPNAAPREGMPMPDGGAQMFENEGNAAGAGGIQGKAASTAQPPAAQTGINVQAASAELADARGDALLTNQSLEVEDTAAYTSKEPPVTGGQSQGAQSLAEKILSVFTKVDESLDAQTLKTAAEQTPYKLAQLQKLIKNIEIGNKETISSQLSEVNAQAKLTQDISRFICMQIPIRQNGYDSAELYIYKRNRKGARIDAENTSVILGLSTQNMGRVEALIRVENRSISLTFGVENEAAIPAFRERSMELYKTLSGMRYSLAEFKVSALSEPATPANAEELLMVSMQKTGASIDYRV